METRKKTLGPLLWLLVLVVLGACLAQESDGPAGSKLANLEVDVQILPPQDPDVFDPALVWYVTAQVGADPVEVDGTLCGRPMAPLRNALLRVPKRSGPLTLRVHVVGPDGQHRALGSGAAALMEIDVALTVDQWTRKSGPWASPCLNGRDGGSNTPDLPLPLNCGPGAYPKSGRCRPCNEDNHCGLQCQPCGGRDAHCTATDPGSCVECVYDWHCTGAARACDQRTNRCVRCTNDSHCPSQTHCLYYSQLCVECVSDAHCKQNFYCNLQKHACRSVVNW